MQVTGALPGLVEQRADVQVSSHPGAPIRRLPVLCPTAA